MSNFVSELTQRYVPPAMPDNLGAWPELKAAADNLRRLEREYSEEAAAAAKAKAEVAQKIADKRAAYTAAKLAGKKTLPKDDGVAKARTDLEEAEDRLAAADAARRQAAQAIVEAIAAHRAEWTPKAEELAERAQAEEADALDAYLAKVESTTRARATAGWLALFPEVKQFKPYPPHLQHVGRRDPVPWAELAHALRIRAGLEAPPPRTLKEQVEARGLIPAQVIGGPGGGEAA
jgi:hypothetical protein